MRQPRRHASTRNAIVTFIERLSISRLWAIEALGMEIPGIKLPIPIPIGGMLVSFFLANSLIETIGKWLVAILKIQSIDRADFGALQITLAVLTSVMISMTAAIVVRAQGKKETVGFVGLAPVLVVLLPTIWWFPVGVLISMVVIFTIGLILIPSGSSGWVVRPLIAVLILGLLLGGCGGAVAVLGSTPQEGRIWGLPVYDYSKINAEATAKAESAAATATVKSIEERKRLAPTETKQAQEFKTRIPVAIPTRTRSP